MSRVGGAQSSLPDSPPQGKASGLGSGWEFRGEGKRGILQFLITVLLVAATNNCSQHRKLV